MANPEDHIQAAGVSFIRTVAPHLQVFAVPNGGLRGKAEAARMKWTGVQAGIPDVCIVMPGGRVAFIEFKAPGGTLSAAQRLFREWCAEHEVPWALCRSVEDVRVFLLFLNIETREVA